jgi:hypothetical protein
MRSFCTVRLAFFLLLSGGVSPIAWHDAAAQVASPRFGIGFNAMLSSADGLGVGFRGRASAPVNQDLSIAIDLGFTGFVLSGRRNAEYIFDPQLSAIINLPSTPDRLGYILFGLGGYIPMGSDTEDQQNGPTVHGGIGWVHALQETSLYYEVNPALVIGERDVDIVIPVRIGVIF